MLPDLGQDLSFDGKKSPIKTRQPDKNGPTEMTPTHSASVALLNSDTKNASLVVSIKTTFDIAPRQRDSGPDEFGRGTLTHIL